MKQFSIQALFGFKTLAAVVCGLLIWFGWNAFGFLLCVFIIGGPLAGSAIMIRWSESMNAPRNSFIGGVIGGAGGYLAVCLSMAVIFGGLPLRPALWGSMFLIGLFGLAGAVTFGGIVGLLVLVAWALIKSHVNGTLPANSSLADAVVEKAQLQ
ncbi:MAG: hypothetical protein NXI22_25910 [bacterium]|nr:hypothetical protein [bacterium]